MSYSQENGYLPNTFNGLMDVFMGQINAQFNTTYTTETFVGTGWYKFSYAITQLILQNEIKASEIFLKAQEYIRITNQVIQRPSVSLPGLIDSFESAGFTASVKPPQEADAGLVNICIDVPDSIGGTPAAGIISITSYANLLSGTPDAVHVGATQFTAQSGSPSPGAGTFQAAASNSATATSLASQINAHATAGALVTAVADGAIVRIKAKTRGVAGNSIVLSYTNNDANVGATVSASTLLGGLDASGAYAAQKLTLCTKIKDFVAAGMVTQGDQTESITISNGQSFDFSFHLPNRIPVVMRMTADISDNNLLSIPDDEAIRQTIFDNIGARYRLGWNFEPQRYYTASDALWSGDLILEYSFDDGVNWHSTVYDANFDDIFTFALEDISVVINP